MAASRLATRGESKIMDSEQLSVILKKHTAWLRADLHGADLHRADLREALLP